jgi:acetoin utilization protein AcuB
MSSRVVSIEPKEPLAAARKLLESNGVRQLPVVHDGLLVGIITDRDLRAAAADASSVEEVMTRDPITIESSHSVDEAARLLRRCKVNALPVVDGDRLEGILSTSDVLDAFVLLSGVAEPTYRLVIEAPGGLDTDTRLRSILGQHHAELLWMRRSSGRHRSQVHVRLRTDHLDDIETSLEAAGFEVLATITSGSTEL